MDLFRVKKKLEERQNKLILGWPENLTVLLDNYMQKYEDGDRIFRENQEYGFPFWFLMPYWLFRKLNSESEKKNGQRFITNILWAQHCLIMFIRIQDDVIDANAADNVLILAADQFLIEAEKTLNIYFDKSKKLRDEYYSCFKKTTLSLASAEDLHRNESTDKNMLARSYAATAAIFNVANAAVCAEFEIFKILPHMKKAGEEISIAGQILDDLTDIKEDLGLSKKNYAERILYNDNKSHEITDF